MEVITEVSANQALPLTPWLIVDPLDDDRADDETITTTRRAISRVALAAAEVGGRFQREAIDHDPMSWMLAPRRMFGGRSAVDACLEQEHCLRAVLTHGLGLGLDPEPEMLDALLAHDGNEDEDDDDDFFWIEPDVAPERAGWPGGALDSPRLITATVCYADEVTMITAFHASITSNPQEVMDYLEQRYGVDVLPTVRLRQGYFPADPLVIALVPDPIAEMILEVEAQPHPRTNSDFIVDIEQRIQG